MGFSVHLNVQLKFYNLPIIKDERSKKMEILKLLKTKILGYRAYSDTYVDHLRSIGVSVGEGVEIFRPFNTTIDIQNPHLLSIGNYVQITGPVTIMTHDYSWSVLKRKYGYIYGNQEKTSIGNNAFIGWGATILAGSTIGDNVIIGANTVISGKVSSNSVYAGNPGKKIMTLEQFKKKREGKQLKEALNYIKEFELEIETETNNNYIIKISDEEKAHKLLNKLILDGINVDKFEIKKPTLNDIFIEKVGE